jgi:hypothetical protein
MESKTEELFDDIISHNNIKRLFSIALNSDEQVSILLSGHPCIVRMCLLFPKCVCMCASTPSCYNNYYIERFILNVVYRVIAESG